MGRRWEGQRGVPSWLNSEHPQVPHLPKLSNDNYHDLRKLTP